MTSVARSPMRGAARRLLRRRRERLLPFTAHRVQLDDGKWTTRRGRGDDPMRALRTKALLGRFDGDLSGKRVLDLGCLEGGYTVAFARLGAAEAVGVEARQASIARCRFLERRLALPNLRFIHADVRQIERASEGEFDIVFASGILYHLDDPFTFLERVAEMCADLALIDTHVAHPDSVAHLCSPELVEREYRGRAYRGRNKYEYPADVAPETVERLAWASYGNPTSFWLTQESLLELLRAVGLARVEKVPTPRPYFCAEGCVEECRVLLLASKA